MKDEEMAKEYAEKAVEEYLNEVEVYHVQQEIEQALLAGLKAGRPQWHDLRKDPTDLPEKCSTSNRTSKCVIGVIEHWADNHYWSKECYYNFVEKKWSDHIDPYVPNVVAWCELPTFDEE